MLFAFFVVMCLNFVASFLAVVTGNPFGFLTAFAFLFQFFACCFFKE
jgi:hypothetical protein